MKSDDFLRQNSSNMHAAAYVNEVTAASVIYRIDALSLNHQALIKDGDLNEDTEPALSDRSATNALIRDQGAVIGIAQANSISKWHLSSDNELQSVKHDTQAHVAAEASHTTTVSTITTFMSNEQQTAINHVQSVDVESIAELTSNEVNFLSENGISLSEMAPIENAQVPTNVPASNAVQDTSHIDSDRNSIESYETEAVENIQSRTLIPEFKEMLTDQGVKTNPDSSIEDPRPLFSGEAEAGSTVEIFDNDKLMGVTFADDSGKWEFVPFDDLESGKHSFTAEVGGVKSQPFIINVEIPEPQVSIKLIDLLTEYNDVLLPQITPIEEETLQLAITPEDMMWETPYDRMYEMLNTDRSVMAMASDEQLHQIHAQ